MTKIIGIDLGTTNSLCAIFENGSPKLIPNVLGEVLTPSVIGILEDDQIIVGSAAKELRITKPDRCVSCFKRWMGTNQSVKIGKRKFDASELSSMILKSLKQDAEIFLDEKIHDAVITVPAYFNEVQRKSTKMAGEMAGLRVRRIINEPTAAALTYGFHDRQSEKHLIVIDLGGGTFDVTLMEIFDGTLEIISTAGESQLGGEDFTGRLVATVLKKNGMQLESAELKHPLLVARLRQECEQAKRKLFEEDAVRIRMPDQAGTFDEQSAFKLDRPTYAKIVNPLVQRIKRPVEKAIRDGDCEVEQIDEIILVGGATRMPVMRDFAVDFFEREPLSTFNPDEVVALGAAVQAALILDDNAVEDMVMTDVCPFTLGVEIAKEFGGRISDGFFQPVIHRNTTIPVSKEETFYTIQTNQPTVMLRVFQGESRKIKDNLDLGQLEINGIPPGPAGQEVQVRFTYDLNGLLEVEAKIPATGKKFQLLLQQHAGHLSQEEIERATKAMQELKFYPRDDLENQRLMLFCERMVGEVSPFHRQQLEEAIDIFEHAMASGDRELFVHSREGLLMTLSQLGIEYRSDEVSDE